MKEMTRAKINNSCIFISKQFTDRVLWRVYRGSH